MTGFLCVGFCAVMTVLLLRMTYFPDSSRLALESPDLVMERVLSRSGTESALDIWKGNDLIGSLRLEPIDMPPLEKKRMGATARLKIEGILGVDLPGFAKTSLNLRGSMAMGLDAEVKDSNLNLSLQQHGLSLNIISKFGIPEPHFILSQGNEVLFDSTHSTDSASSRQLVEMLLSTVQMDSRGLKKEASKAAASLTEARRGKFTVMNREFNGYQLTTTLGGGGDRKFTLFISDSGEIIQMLTSFLDYKFISADLRPDGINDYQTEALKQFNLPGPPPTPLPK